MSQLGEEVLLARAAALEWLLCDVDGVLTDGGLYFDGSGEALKRFHVQDGLGLQLLKRAGIAIGVLSARASAPLDRRIAELGLDLALTGAHDKRRAFVDFLDERGVAAERVAFIGDDLTDLPVLTRCGLAFAPADAAPEVRQAVHLVLNRRGGHGVVRELAEWVLRARGDWQRALTPFVSDD